MKTIVLVYNGQNGSQFASAKAIDSFFNHDEFASYHYTLDTEFFFTICCRIYRKAILSPFFYPLIWFIVNNTFFCKCIFHYGRHVAKKHKTKIQRLHPDLLISTHPFANAFVTAIGEYLSIPTVIQITDPFAIHGVWTCASPTYFFVPTKQAEEIIHSRNPRAKIVVLPYPIHESFYSTQKTKEEIFKKYDLVNQYTITISGGSFGILPRKYIEQIIALSFSKANICILCGMNVQLKSYFTQYCSDAGMDHVRILDQSANIAEILQITDLHFLKSGTTALFESLASLSIPFVYSSLKEEDVRSKRVLELEGIGRAGKIETLIPMMFLCPEEIETYHKHIRQFLENVALQKGKEQYSKFFRELFQSANEIA